MRNSPSVFIAVAVVIGFSIGMSQRAETMPVFAQAYGVKCSVCHTQVPALNTYGRYVQRTGYASLDPKVLRRAFPLWFGEAVTYDSLAGAKPQFGNVEIHAAGGVGDDLTYHFQQWVYQGNQAGDLDTFWISYNNLLHRDGHLFVGLIEAPGPSPYSQWMDLAGFTTPEIAVGEHTYELDGNRWGAKFNYIKSNIDVEAGYLASNEGWVGASDWGSDTEKTFQYKAAYANPQQPAEVGVYGSRGSSPLAEGGTDQYWSFAPYVQRDPSKGVPGILLIYQMAHDGNPGYTTLPNGSLVPLGQAASTATTLELYQPIMDKGLISFRKEFTNDGLGNQMQTGNIDLNYQVAKYLHVYVENYFAQGSIPGWRYMLWWTTPVTTVK